MNNLRTPLELAQAYKELGLQTVSCKDKTPYNFRQGTRLTAWQTEFVELTEANFPNNSRTQVGVITGEISGNIIDLDADDQDVANALLQLCPTTPTFGRLSKPNSHYWVRIIGDTGKYVKHVDKLAEYRQDGHQTIAPGSIHAKTGELIVWVPGRSPDEVPYAELTAAAAQYILMKAVVFALVKKCYGNDRHLLLLPLAGGLKKAGWTLAEVEELFEWVCQQTGDAEVTDRLRVVADTFSRGTDDHTTGWPTLEGYVGKDVVAKIKQTLHVNDEGYDTKRYFSDGFKPNVVKEDLKRDRNLLLIGSTPCMHFNGVYYRPIQGYDPLAILIGRMLGDRSTKDNIQKVLDLCEYDEEIPRWVEDDERYCNFTNGLLDLQTRQMIPHTPDVMSTFQFPYPLDLSVDTTEMRRYFESVLVPDQVDRFLEYVGLTYTTYAKKHMALIVGEHNSGKNICANILESGFGRAAVSHSTLRQLTSTSAFHLAPVAGKVSNICDESSNLRDSALEALKSLWNGQKTPVQFERKHRDALPGLFTLTGFFFCNDLPEFSTSDVKAFEGRLLVFRFPNAFKHNVENDELAKYYSGLVPQQLAPLAITSLFHFLDRGGEFADSESSDAEREAYILENNELVPLFEGNYFEGGLGRDCYTVKNDLYEAYKTICGWQGTNPLSQGAFKNKLLALADLFNFKLDQKQILRPNGKWTPQIVWIGIRARHINVSPDQPTYAATTR